MHVVAPPQERKPRPAKHYCDGTREPAIFCNDHNTTADRECRPLKESTDTRSDLCGPRAP